MDFLCVQFDFTINQGIKEAASIDINTVAKKNSDLVDLEKLLIELNRAYLLDGYINGVEYASLQHVVTKQREFPSLNPLLRESLENLNIKIIQYENDDDTNSSHQDTEARQILTQIQLMQVQLLREKQAGIWHQVYFDSAHELHRDSIYNQIIYFFIGRTWKQNLFIAIFLLSLIVGVVNVMRGNIDALSMLNTLLDIF